MFHRDKRNQQVNIKRQQHFCSSSVGGVDGVSGSWDWVLGDHIIDQFYQIQPFISKRYISKDKKKKMAFPANPQKNATQCLVSLEFANDSLIFFDGLATKFT